MGSDVLEATTGPSARTGAGPHDTYAARVAGAAFSRGICAASLVVPALLLVASVAALDRATGSRYSFSLFYLIPVAACAWWGGFPHGVLLALAGSLAWHAVDAFADPSTPLNVMLWNAVVRFGVLTLLSSLVARLHASVRRERVLARTDPLTGAANGRTFYERAAAEASRAGRTGRPFTLAYFDLDDFKPLNDRLGHAVGDAALVKVVHTFQIHLRCSDVLARLGGDEFALLMPDTDGEGALALLGRLREQLGREMETQGWPVTASVGAVTFLRPVQDVDLMVRRVDALMYAAKRRGKGRIEHAVVCELSKPDEPENQGSERRATARLLCQQTAKVWREGCETEQAEFATVSDVSSEGIGIFLDKPLLRGTLVVIEPLAPSARTLLARVLRLVPEDGGWKHGCALSTPLEAEELRAWLGDHAPPDAGAGGRPGRS